VGTDGTKKMSKSYDNHIPLEASPEDMYGKLMSIPDSLVADYAKLLTDLPEQDIDEIQTENRGLKAEKKKVAYAIVNRLKGEDEADEARDYFERTIEENQAPDEEEMETFEVVERDVWIVDLLDQSGLVESRSEAKRLLREGGIYLDGEQLDGFDYDVPMNQPVTLRRGKHQYRRAVPTENG
jgi:tyrosyl-tRNA synthetase